jgi:hypothetical protein
VVGDVVTCGDGRVGQAGALGPHRFGPTWILTGRGRVRAERGAVLDLRGGCPMTAAGCPDRCDCPVNLWAWARPAMAAAISAAMDDALRSGELLDLRAFTCPRCGMTSRNPDDVREGYCGACHDWTREVGTLADPDSPISRWVRGEPLWGDRG